MSLLPERIELELFDAKAPHYTSRTFKKVGNRIFGVVDGRRALEQSIEKILNTERYSTPIYNGDYGVELEELIGMDINFVKADVKRRITEALMEDDRIFGITNFVITQEKLNELLITFSVETEEGVSEIETSLSV